MKANLLTLLFVSIALGISAQPQRIVGMTKRGGSGGSGNIFSLFVDGTGFQEKIAFSFSNELSNGAFPSDGLIEDHEGNLYGMTTHGGSYRLGVIFRLNADVTGYTVLHHFNGTQGKHPEGSLMFGRDGKLYGTTFLGGTQDEGVVFRINTDGTAYNVLHHFNGNDGANPLGSLIQGFDGKLYGMTNSGGDEGGSMYSYGVIFSVATDGTGYTVLHRYDGVDGTGAGPRGSLIQGNDGKLYGMTPHLYANNSGGVLFKVGTDGTGYTVLKSFDIDGYYPLGSLIQGRDGKLYGTTIYGSNLGSWGVVFTIDTDGANYAVLHNFDSSNGGNLFGSLTQGRDGKLYGMETELTESTSRRGGIFSINTDGTGFIQLRSLNDPNGVSAEGDLLLTGDCPAITLSPNSLPNGTEGVVYNQTLSATGSIAPYTYSVSSGVLPSGLTLSTGGTLSGLATTVGTFSFTVKATDAFFCTGEISLSVTVEPVINCFGFGVTSFTQGKTKQGKVVEAIRSNPQLALGAPQENDMYNFVSLGFGGSITLELEEPLQDNNGYEPDFILVETSFGRADEKCFAGGNTFNYPETAVIEVSDGVTWRSLPDSYCRTSFIDISSVIDGSFSYVKRIRIKDFSNKDFFEANADGFDVDGIIVCPEAVQLAFTEYTNSRVAGSSLWDGAFFNRAPNEAKDEAGALRVYPNPTVTQISIEFFSEQERNVPVQVISAVGTEQTNNVHQLRKGWNVLTEDVTKLSPGVYLIKVGNQSTRFVRE